MAVPGWYRDPGSDRLARWFDGKEWTHHTVVMEEWRGRGTPPPPEDRTIVQSSSDAYVPPPSGDWAEPTGPAGPAGYEDVEPYEYDDFSTYGSYAGYEDDLGTGGYTPTLADRYREAPSWFRFGAPALVVLIVVVATAALAGGGSGGGGGEDLDTRSGEVSLEDAVELAYDAGFPRTTREVALSGLIKSACAQVGEDDGAERVADSVLRLGFDGSELSGAARGLRAAGEAYCADELEDDPSFFRDVALAISGQVPAATTTTADSSTTSTSVEPSTTTSKKTTTTKKPAPKPTSTTPTTVDDSIPDEPDDSTTTTASTTPPSSTTTPSSVPPPD